jgi:hypothetical protein
MNNQPKSGVAAPQEYTVVYEGGLEGIDPISLTGTFSIHPPVAEITAELVGAVLGADPQGIMMEATQYRGKPALLVTDSRYEDGGLLLADMKTVQTRADRYLNFQSLGTAMCREVVFCNLT